MEIITLVVLVGLVVLWVSNRDLKRRIEWLEQRFATPDEARPPPERAAQAAFTVAPPMRAPSRAEFVPPSVEPSPPLVIELPDEEAAERETIGGLFERLVAGRLLIWLGAAALAIAGVFLVRFSIAYVTPEIRMVAAALFGLALLVGGEYARAGRLLSDDPRYAQALVGAGIAVLYATAYGSHILYGLIGTAGASAAMLAITGLALVLSLRHGAPAAVIGLTGGFLTPLLVGDPDAGAVPLLAYLALLDLAIFLIAWRRGWTWLAAGAVALSFVWSAYLLSQPADDALASGAFVVLLALAASLVRPGEGRELGLIQPMAIGIVQLAVLVARTDLGLPAWGLFGALAAASLALAALREGYRLAPPVALALGLALLLAKATTGEDPLVPVAAAGLTALFGLGGLALVLWQARLRWTSIAAAGLAGPALIVRAVRPELLERPAWGALTLLLAAGAAALVWLNRGRASDKPPADLALLLAGAAAVLLLGAAMWDLLAPDWVAAGWLAVSLPTALAARRLRDLALATVAAAVAAVAVARCMWMVPELSTAAVTAVVGDPVLAADLPNAAEALSALGVPALLLFALALVLPPLPLGARRALPAVAALFAAAALYVGFKQAFGLASEEDFVARGLLERTILTQALFALGWLLGSGRLRVPRIEPDLVRLAGTALTLLAAVRLIWFDILVHNPAWSDQWVGALPVANLILPAYLLSAVWLYAARRRSDAATRSGFWLVAFLAALLAGVALLVRQAFHGPILAGPDMPIAELYGYSVAGLVTAIGLLLAGIKLPDKAVRLAGLLLLSVTAAKVFLYDTKELEGVLRILSVLGLGIALIGIGRLYGPVLRAEAGSRHTPQAGEEHG